MVTRVGPIDGEIPCSASDSDIGFGPSALMFSARYFGAAMSALCSAAVRSA